MKYLLSLLLLPVSGIVFSQSVTEKLSAAYQQFENDPQLNHAIASLYVVDAKTGEVIFDKNGETGLAPASCQKLFTSAAAFELLGHDFRYKTELGYDGKIEDLALKGNLHIVGSGDPTLGSWRWKETKEETVLNEFLSSLKQFHINKITGTVFINDSRFSIQPIPDGWIWQDIGNYYGAGCWGLNWRENQYDMFLKPGNQVGAEAEIMYTKPQVQLAGLINQLKTGEKSSGDNAYIYLPPYAGAGFTQGTVPQGEASFTISGAIPDPPAYFSQELEKLLKANKIQVGKGYKTYMDKLTNKEVWPSLQTSLFTHLSPTLDSINYWFLKKSINLYGEALIKTIAAKKTGTGSTEKGVELLRDFWSAQGIEPAAINVIDGSGLSPQNRVTTHALVTVLQYAAGRPWFNSFYEALPEINGMKMKSGSIGGARSYAGYQKSGDGRKYSFAIIVNNYDGSPAEVVKKMWKVLDTLK